jgi:serine/threonine protein kinase
MARNPTAAPRDFYSLLTVSPAAEMDVIKAAYHALMLRHHPDHGGDAGICAALNGAAAILLDPAKRSAYDGKLEKDRKGVIGLYKVIEEIGSGEFGRTYKAEHILLKELACLKQQKHLNPVEEADFIQEAKTIWNIHHYSLPSMRDFFRGADGCCVLAMSYIPGKNLQKLVQKRGGLDPETVCWISQRLLNALHYLHFNGVVHCDIKPANVILEADASGLATHNAVLVDYGFASLQPSRHSKPAGYTPLYAPPELIACRPPLPESDLYSLGCTMLFALGATDRQLAAREAPKGTPTSLEEFINHLVLHNPSERPTWEKADLVKQLSDIREKAFGRRNSNIALKLED